MHPIAPSRLRTPLILLIAVIGTVVPGCYAPLNDPPGVSPNGGGTVAQASLEWVRPTPNQTLLNGTELTIEVALNSSWPVARLEVTLGGKNIVTVEEPAAASSWVSTWTVTDIAGGRYQLRVAAYDGDARFIASDVTPIVIVRDPVPVFSFETTARYPHDRGAFTQGLIYLNGTLYEGTGRYGESELREVDLATGTVLARRELPPNRFGEGITVRGDRLYQLTWKAGEGYIYSRSTFERVGEYSYNGEGWGLATDGERLIMSDGSATLRFLDADTFEVVRRVEVRAAGEPVRNLNELEYIDGVVYANIWYEDRIAMIEPHTGTVLGWIDCSGLKSELEDSSGIDVLNGIASDESSGELLLTGKFWPNLFRGTINRSSLRRS